MPERRRSRSFGPTVLIGLAAGALTAVSASRDWATASGRGAGAAVAAGVKGSSSAPLAVALALVALAAWGVVLVVRGRARRVVSVVGVVAAAGVVATVVATHGRAQHDAVRAVTARGGMSAGIESSLTGWYFVCAVAALLTTTSLVVAVRLAPGWPAMGSRYDAPAGRPEAPVTEQDMWKALDDGRDPTA